MLKHRKRLIAATGALITAGMISVSGVMAAAAAQPAGRAAVSGTEHFQLVSASATSNTALVIASGAFTAHAVDHMGNKVDTFKFRNGSFKVAHSPGKGPQSFNPKTCLLTVSRHGTYTIGHGTGKYAGISGHGKYQLSILAIGARSGGKCSKRKAPAAFEQIIKASGPVHR
jgi:hypothetical protein